MTSDAAIPLDRIVADGVQGAADGRVAVLIWHSHDDDVAGPDADQCAALEAASRMTPATIPAMSARGTTKVTLTVPRQGVAFVIVNDR